MLKTAGAAPLDRAGTAWSGVSFFMFISGVVVNKFFFVLAHAPFKFVDEAINCGVHVLFDVVTINGTAIDAGSGLGFVP